MKIARLAIILPLALALAAPARADIDTDFANELHTYGIYGQRDYNAWIAKIACKRLDRGLDTDAFEAAQFVQEQLHKNATVEQSWQFLGAAVRYYCPGQMSVLQRAANQ